MKKIIFLLLITTSINAQVRQFNDYIFVFPSGSIIGTATMNGTTFNSVITTDTLLRIYGNGICVWKANLQSSNISDTLSATGITGICRITVPNTFGTNTIIQIRDIAIIIPNATYSLEYSTLWQFPIDIIRMSDGVKMCSVYETGFIDWLVNPQWSWLGRVGTTRIKRITLP